MRLLGFAFIVGACAPPRAAESASPAPTRSVDVPRVVVTPDRATSLDELFAEAAAAAEKGDLAGAARGFDRVEALEPRGALAGEALFQSGYAHDLLGHHREALERFRRLVEQHPGHARARHATLRAVRLLNYLEDFTWAGRYADRLLAASDLRPFEAVVAYSGKALAAVNEGDDLRASAYVERGRDVVERERLDLAGRLPIDLAPLYFALGEVHRVRAERLRFTPLPPDFSVALERRCQLILDAQRAYSDTWRAYDAHWSTLAGYRLASMYESLHRELVAIPPPAPADTKARQDLFEAAMRFRYAVLLEKARSMLEHTVAMAVREGERSAWVERAQQSLLDIRAAESAEQAALDRLPYSRADLEEVLRSLKEKSAKASAAQAPSSRGINK